MSYVCGTNLERLYRGSHDFLRANQRQILNVSPLRAAGLGDVILRVCMCRLAANEDVSGHTVLGGLDGHDFADNPVAADQIDIAI